MSFTLIAQVMIIESIPPSRADTVPVVHQLPEPDMVVDPRPTNYNHCIGFYNFEVSIKGTTIILTRIYRKENEMPGWSISMDFRV